MTSKELLNKLKKIEKNKKDFSELVKYEKQLIKVLFILRRHNWSEKEIKEIIIGNLKLWLIGVK